MKIAISPACSPMRREAEPQGDHADERSASSTASSPRLIAASRDRLHGGEADRLESDPAASIVCGHLLRADHFGGSAVSSSRCSCPSRTASGPGTSHPRQNEVPRRLVVAQLRPHRTAAASRRRRKTIAYFAGSMTTFAGRVRLGGSRGAAPSSLIVTGNGCAVAIRVCGCRRRPDQREHEAEDDQPRPDVVEHSVPLR